MTYDPMAWAEGLIQQLPEHHEGAAGWLLNHGNSPRAHALRAVRAAINDEPKTADVVDSDEMSLHDANVERLTEPKPAFFRKYDGTPDAARTETYPAGPPSRPATAADVTQLWAAVDELKAAPEQVRRIWAALEVVDARFTGHGNPMAAVALQADIAAINDRLNSDEDCGLSPDDGYLRFQALELAIKATAGMSMDITLKAARDYLDFLGGVKVTGSVDIRAGLAE